MSRTTLTAAIVASLLTAPAFASSIKCDSPSQDQWMAKADLTTMYEGQGFDVKNIKAEDGCYEVYALDAKGVRVEIIADPMTGKQLGIEND